MATLISLATGNWTAAGTWGLVDATSLLDSEAANTALTTSYVESSTFTPGAITIDGIAVKLASRATGSPSNTISVRLALAGVTVPGTEVTINVADIAACSTTQNEGGWYLFKFAAPVLLVAATLYTASAKLSSTSTAVNLYRNATAGNWSRLLRTTTTQAPVAGDIMHAIGEHTGAGTGNSFVVTMDETATTDYGAAVANTPAVTGGKRGTLTWGVTASTNYYLKLSGDLILYSGATYNRGTSGTPMPSTSTAILEFDPAADGDCGFIARNGSVVNDYGATTATWTLLTVDAAAAATVLTVASTAGMVAGKQVVIATTARPAITQTEVRTISTVDSGTQITLTAGLTNAHSGTAGRQAEVVYLDRSNKTRSATSTLMAYISIKPTCVFNAQYVEYYYFGEGASAPKRGIESETTTGVFDMRYCSLHDFEDGGMIFNTTAGAGITFTGNVSYNLNTVISQYSFLLPAVTGTPTVTDSVWLNCFAPGAGAIASVHILDIGLTFTGNRIAGAGGGANNGIGLYFGETALASGVNNNNVVHSCESVGVIPVGTGTFGSMTVWRCGLSSMDSSGAVLVTLESWSLYGAGTSNIRGAATTALIMKSCILAGDTGFATPNGITLFAAMTVWLVDCTLGSPVAHTTGDLIANGGAQFYLTNTTLASATEVSGQTSLAELGFIRSHKHDASGTTFKDWYGRGTVQADTAIRHTAAGYSWKLTPLSAVTKLRFPGPLPFGPPSTFRAAVDASAAATVTVWVRKDATYNGSAPRLVLVGGAVGGIAADVVDGLSVGVDTWEQLSVSGTPNEAGAVEWYVDCDGTAGNVYVQDAEVAGAALLSALVNMGYVSRAIPMVPDAAADSATAGAPLSRVRTGM